MLSDRGEFVPTGGIAGRAKVVSDKGNLFGRLEAEINGAFAHAVVQFVKNLHQPAFFKVGLRRLEKISLRVIFARMSVKMMPARL